MFSNPKPEKRATTKRRKDRKEAAVASAVRATVSERDGFCRLFTYDSSVYQMFGSCQGLSQWAHLGDARRFKTRGMEPTLRHTSSGSLMFCARHHQDYDAHRMQVEALTDRGADGPLRFTIGESVYTERMR